jgi:hypothetical protein
LEIYGFFYETQLVLHFFDINGTRKTPRDTSEIIYSYSPGRDTIPKFVQRIEAKSVVPDSFCKEPT